MKQNPDMLRALEIVSSNTKLLFIMLSRGYKEGKDVALLFRELTISGLGIDKAGVHEKFHKVPEARC